MNKEIKLRKYKKHIMELKFLRSELQYQEEVLSVAHQDFEVWYREWCGKNNINLGELNTKHETRVSKLLPPSNFPDLKHDEHGISVLRENPVEKKEQKKFTSLFKQVAKSAHPDKPNGSSLNFAAASAAYETGDWSRLLEIAEIYGIFPNNIEEIYPLMKEQASKLRKKIKNNKATYSWRLYECETEECKEVLVKQFLKHLFKVEL
jgi:hypothetical protein